MGVMARFGDLHCHGVLDAFGEGVVVVRRDRLVVGAPCNQQWYIGEQAQLTVGSDHLPTPVDDRAGGLEKRLSLLFFRQTAQDIREHSPVRASYQPGNRTKYRPCQTGWNRAESGNHGVCARERGRPEDGCHLGAEAATADQHEAIGAFGELVGGL